MSWSISKTGIPVENIEFELYAERDRYLAQFGPETNSVPPLDEAKEQINSAVVAAVELARHVGAWTVHVSLSGHANPEHKPVAGWSNDGITVTVTNADPVEEDLAAPVPEPVKAQPVSEEEPVAAS